MRTLPALLVVLALHLLFFGSIVLGDRTLSPATFTSGLTPHGPYGAPPPRQPPHVLEPSDLWQKYLEPEFHAYMPQHTTGYVGNPPGWDLEIKVLGSVMPNFPAGKGMAVPGLEEAYGDFIPRGFDPSCYREVLERTGIDYMVVYPTAGLYVTAAPGLGAAPTSASAPTSAARTTAGEDLRPGKAIDRGRGMTDPNFEDFDPKSTRPAGVAKPPPALCERARA